MEFLGGEIKIVDGYVLVCNESVPDRRRAREILSTVDIALDRSGYRSVLFDTREMPAPVEEVNQILRHWVDACAFHDRVALLVKSDLKLVASNMRALAAKVKLRSFHELVEAEDWLRAPAPRPREVTRPISEPRPAACSSRDRRAEQNRRYVEGLERRGDVSKREASSSEGAKRFQWRSPLLREYLDD